MYVVNMIAERQVSAANAAPILPNKFLGDIGPIECGLTERQAREAEAAAAAARTRSHPDKHTRIQPIAEPAEKVLAREQLRIYDNCMATDKTMVQCGKRAGFVD